MNEEQKYLWEVKCSGIEEHNGWHWVSEEELSRLKQKVAENEIVEGCSHCKVTVKDREDNVVFQKEGC